MLDTENYTPLKAFAATSGPRDAKIVLVGEAWGESEDEWHSPFVGASGYELSKMVHEAGLAPEAPLSPKQFYLFGSQGNSLMLQGWWNRQPLLLTNTFAFRPAQNKINFICGKKAEVGGKTYKLEPIGKEGYIRPQYLAELARLKEELLAYPRTCAVAIGAKASWALLGSAKITKLRGVTAPSSLVPGLKVLPSYHPAGIMRNWAWRPIGVADLAKVARREGLFSEIIRPERQVRINPTLEEVRTWLRAPTWRLGVDTETKIKQIEMVGLARSASDAIIIPLFDTRFPDGSYWSAEDEREIWQLLRWRLEDPKIEKVFQNGLYDLQYFVRRSPIRPRGCTEDTMLLHHALFPEMPKGLGFLGSIYTNEASWKMWRGREQEALKRDE